MGKARTWKHLFAIKFWENLYDTGGFGLIFPTGYNTLFLQAIG